ncbi:MAG: hypothetical protein RAK22_01005 [Nanoarchaeota archaeon]|nr:hypothetical protein [Nanoarchaeota archaeon]
MKIGLEVHVALPTRTKLFCACSTEETEEPNENVCPTCMGFPGSKPVLNKEAVRIAKSIAFVLGCKIREKISFVRKVYFYPDLPKNFQISQLDASIGYDGEVSIKTKKIRIRRVQIEEDPAKILREKGMTLLDFNRSGVPLVEIVTEPDITSEQELRMFMHELRSILYYQGVDIDREVKADLNISLGKERVEVKNVTGIKNLIDAARYEIDRQKRIIDQGREPIKETRFYDEDEKITKSAREKEADEEYGYIYETDLTDYDTRDLIIDQGVIPSKEAKELSEKYGFDEQVLDELISLDRDAYRLIVSAAGRYDPQIIVSVVEQLKKFGEQSISEAAFKALLGLGKEVSLTREMIDKAKKGESIETSVNKENIEEKVRKYIQDNKALFEKAQKDPKVQNFIIGEISRKYQFNPKQVSDIIKNMKLFK